MAKQRHGILSGFTGKVGNVVGKAPGRVCR